MGQLRRIAGLANLEVGCRPLHLEVQIPVVQEHPRRTLALQALTVVGLNSFPSRRARPCGVKRKSSGISDVFGAYAGPDGGNEVGFSLVPRARSIVGPETLRAPRIVARGREALEHD